MRTALIIAVYFGPLPKWFPLWCESCRRNPEFDWLLIGDHLPPQPELPANIKRLPIDLQGLRDSFAAKMGFEPCIPAAYKICDFRPAFGFLFAEQLEGYRFWGFCDLDVLFGRLGHCITPSILARYDRILSRGHLSLIRNTPELREAYRWPYDGPDYREIFTRPTSYIFDEWPGLHKILTQHNKPQYCDEIVADIDPEHPTFNLTRHENYPQQAFVWRDGRVEQLFVDPNSGQVQCREFVTIHFQKRTLPCSLREMPEGGVAITPRGIVPIRGQLLAARDLSRYSKARQWWHRPIRPHLNRLRIFIGRQRQRLLPSRPKSASQ